MRYTISVHCTTARSYQPNTKEAMPRTSPYSSYTTAGTHSCIQGVGVNTYLVITIVKVVVKESPSEGVKLTVLFSVHESIQLALKEDMQQQQDEQED